MTVLAYIFLTLSLLHLVIAIITGVMRTLGFRVKNYYLVISNQSMSLFLGVIGPLSALYLMDPYMFKSGGIDDILLKVCILCMFMALIFQCIGYFVDRRRKAIFESEVE